MWPQGLPWWNVADHIFCTQHPCLQQHQNNTFFNLEKLKKIKIQRTGKIMKSKNAGLECVCRSHLLLSLLHIVSLSVQIFETKLQMHFYYLKNHKSRKLPWHHNIILSFWYFCLLDFWSEGTQSSKVTLCIESGYIQILKWVFEKRRPRVGKNMCIICFMTHLINSCID